MLERFPLGALVDEVGQHIGLPEGGTIAWRNGVENGFEVEADREQLFRVFMNLGRNAVQALGESGEVRIDAEAVGERVEIELTDDGPGLPERARSHLFEPFTGSARSGGTGLGLAIARELLRGHGGDLELLRSGDEGTTFRITLPKAAGPARRPH